MSKYPVRTEGPMSLNKMPTEVLKDEIAELKEKLERMTIERDRYFNQSEDMEMKFHESEEEVSRLKELVGRMEADCVELAQLKMEGRIKGKRALE